MQAKSSFGIKTRASLVLIKNKTILGSTFSFKRKYSSTKNHMLNPFHITIIDLLKSQRIFA